MTTTPPSLFSKFIKKIIKLFKKKEKPFTYNEKRPKKNIKFP